MGDESPLMQRLTIISPLDIPGDQGPQRNVVGLRLDAARIGASLALAFEMHRMDIDSVTHLADSVFVAASFDQILPVTV